MKRGQTLLLPPHSSVQPQGRGCRAHFSVSATFCKNVIDASSSSAVSVRFPAPHPAASEGLESHWVAFSLPTLQSAFQIFYLIVINSTRLYCMSSLTVQLSVIGSSNTSVGQQERHTHANSTGLELGSSFHPRLLYRIPEVGFPGRTSIINPHNVNLYVQ